MAETSTKPQMAVGEGGKKYDMRKWAKAWRLVAHLTETQAKIALLCMLSSMPAVDALNVARRES